MNDGGPALPMPRIAKRYLGDAVYVDWYHGMVKLTTEDGKTTSNTIFLEPTVMQTFLEWYEREMAQIRAENTEAKEEL